MKKLIALRRLSQTIFLALFIYILWSTTYPLKGLFPSDAFFKINPLIMIFTSISERLMLPGILFSLGMLVITFIVGRFFCGWVCPLGTIIDVCGSIGKRSRIPGDKTNKKIRAVKYGVIALIALCALFGIQIAWIFDPMVIAARFVSVNLIPAVTYLLKAVFVILIRDLRLTGAVRDLYHTLSSSILGVQAHFFSHSGVIFLFFLSICCTVFILKRFWCRSLCPLGALYALTARFSILRRVVKDCSTCYACRKNCRMAAIREDIGYEKGECILCMDCIYDCPVHGTKFVWPRARDARRHKRPPQEAKSVFASRRDFLFLLFSSTLIYGFGRARVRSKQRNRSVIRPPASLPEEDFTDRCIRCANCMKVCITNGLQPVMLQSGFEGIWTPQLVPEIGYCEYQCTLCGNVCPTGAIKPLTVKEKKYTRLGLATVDRSLCIPWTQDKPCIVCEEHCPIPEKAIKLTSVRVNGIWLQRPSVDYSLCVGCGICQNKCPVRPLRAIRVRP